MRSKLPLLASLLLAALPSLATPHLLASPSSDLQRTLNTDPNEPTRLAAFSKLEAANALDSTQITRSITDTSPAIRANALRVGTRLVASDPELELRLLALANDRTSPVRLQLLASLPAFPHPKASLLYFHTLTAEIENPKSWPLAIATHKENLWPFLTKLTTSPTWKKQSPGRIQLVELAANAIRDSASLHDISTLLEFASADNPADQLWIRLSLLRGLLGHLSSPRECSPLQKPVHLEALPAPLQMLLSSKDSDIRKILKTPGALLSWPSPP